MVKTYKYRIYPNKEQRSSIDQHLIEACRLYNAALEHRIGTYKATGKSVSYYDQAAELKDIRSDGTCGIANYSACQAVLRKVDKTFKAFFGRVKKGKKAGFPRFKSSLRYHTVEFPSYGDGCKLKGSKVYLQGIGNINIRLHRPVEGKIKTVTVTRKNGKYYVCFCSSIENTPEAIGLGSSVGIDMGLESFLITSDGEFVDNPRYLKHAQRKLRVLQRAVSRKKKGSNSRKKAVTLLAKQHEHIHNQRRDFAHKLADRLVKENTDIYIEDLNIKGLASGMLAKSVNDASWGMFFNFLSYKAENAGKRLIKVDPRGTSQRCHNCGNTVAKGLAVRKHVCTECGISCHRDLNSALEILRLGTSLNPLTWEATPSVGLEALSL